MTTLHESIVHFIHEDICPLWVRNRLARILETSYISGIPDDAFCFFPEGSMIACVRGNFINLHESHAGFGFTNEEALANLLGKEKR